MHGRVDATAVRQVFEFFWPHALKGGWRHIYLGSPVPGLRDWLVGHPDGRVEDYAYSKRRGLPVDPQLRYYHSKGFRTVVRIVRGYFPHERSLDHGVIVRGVVPLSSVGWFWTRLPIGVLQRFRTLLFRIL